MNDSKSQQEQKESLIAWLKTLTPSTRIALLLAAKEEKLAKKQEAASKSRKK